MSKWPIGFFNMKQVHEQTNEDGTGGFYCVGGFLVSIKGALRSATFQVEVDWMNWMKWF